MNDYQNFTTIEQVKLDKNTLLRLDQIHEVLSNPKDTRSKLIPVAEPRFVVSRYVKKPGRQSLLEMCEHFSGQTAEFDATRFYLAFVEPEEFELLPLDVEHYTSYQPELSFSKKPH